MNKNDYLELYQKAMKPNAKQSDIEKFANWFEHWGIQYWNGEDFVIDGNRLLHAVFENGLFIKYEII